MSQPIQPSPIFLETLQAFLQDLHRAGRSPRTLEGYDRDLRDFAAWMEDRYGEPFDPRAVLPDDLRDYRQHLLATRRARPATVNRHIAALRAFFNFLATQRKIPSNPADRLPRVREARGAPRALSEAELRRLLREARRSGNPLHWLVMSLLAHAGLRASELCDLRLGDLVVAERQGKAWPRAIRVQGKGEKARTVPLNAPAREALMEWLAVRPSAPTDHVLIGRRGPLTPAGVWRIVDKYARRAGLAGVHPHVLRHTFATRLLRQGVDIVTVAKLLGHESLNTTARYTHPTEQDLEAAVGKLE